jgi:glycosyltransferase involved in cell wall biosynthesis
MGIKVLQFIGSFHQGGSERQAVQLSKLLKESGRCEVFAATLDKSGVLLDEMIEAGFDEIPEYSLSSFFSFGFLRQLFACASYLRKNKIDIVHTHDFYTNVFGIFAAKLAGVKIRIASKRETTGIRTDSQERIEKFAFRLSRRITVNSAAVQKFLVGKGVSEEKIVVTYNGLDLDRIRPKMTDRTDICRELGLPPEKRFVTLVANLRHGVKNQPMLLRCAKNLKEEFPDVHFVFAGEGERKNFLLEMSKKLDVFESTHFIDRCRIVPELLSISEICVLTSYAEGFSNSILEYMAAGKPVVATDVGGARECIADGETGFLVPSDDAAAMSEKLALLLRDKSLSESFGESGRARVVSDFSTRSQLETLNGLYSELTKDV